MAERTKLWVYFVFGAFFTLVYSLVSWIWSCKDGWLFAHGMQDFAGSTVVHYQERMAGLAGALLLGPDREVRCRQPRERDPRPQHGLHDARRGSSSGSGGSASTRARHSSVDFGGVGFFFYVALNTNLAAAAGARRGPSRRGS